MSQTRMTRTVRYTPGPWKAVPMQDADGTPNGLTIEAARTTVATVPESDPVGLMYADGNLLAAAPELLAACKAALEVMAEDHEVCTQLEEAIAKAEGKS